MDDMPIILNVDAQEEKRDIHNEMMLKELRNCFKELMNTQDRVDISLREYEDLKKMNAKLARENAGMTKVLNELGFGLIECECGFDVVDHIVPGSIKTSISEGDLQHVLGNRRIIRIQFVVEG